MVTVLKGKTGWTKEEVVTEIRRRKEEGGSLVRSVVRKEYSKLNTQATQVYGTWKEAIEGAGLDYEEETVDRVGDWTARKVVLLMERRERNGESIIATDVCKSHQRLYAAGLKFFGGWKELLWEMGKDPDDYNGWKRTRTYVSKEEIIKEIRRREVEGLSLNARKVCKTDSPLWKYGKEYFGEWRIAVEKSVIDQEKYKGITKPEEEREDRARKRIKERYEAGLIMKQHEVAQEDWALLSLAKRSFVTWENAVRESGITVSEQELSTRTVWTDELITEKIQEHVRKGSKLTASKIVKVDSNLYNRAGKNYGTWENAVRAAGFDPKEYGVRGKINWTKERIREEVSKRIEQGESLYFGDVGREFQTLYLYGQKLFGSWKALMVEMGQGSDTYTVRVRKYCRGTRRENGKALRK